MSGEDKTGGWAWSAALPFGLVLLACGARVIGAQPVDASAAKLALILHVLGCFALAIGLWTAPEVFETLARLPGSRLRPLAGAARVYVRPPLAALLLAIAAWCSVRIWALTATDVRIFLVPACVPLLLSAYVVFDGLPGVYAVWSGVGAMALQTLTPSAKPGETVRAAAELTRRCPKVSAALLLYDSAASEKNDYLKLRIPGQASLVSGLGGLWTLEASVRVPDDAAPTLIESGDDEDPPWRYWRLEVAAVGENGKETTETGEVRIIS